MVQDAGMPIKPEWIREHGLDQPIPAVVNGRRNGFDNRPEWDAAYHPCPEAFPADGAPRGDVTKFADWSSEHVYPGTMRDLWIYAPAGLARALRPRIVFFNDGAWYLSGSGPVRATHVLDTLLHLGEIPHTVAVFIMPGIPDHPVEGPIESYDDRTAQRSLEYDQPTPRYGRFLFEEVLPFVESHLGCTVSTAPEDRRRHRRVQCRVAPSRTMLPRAEPLRLVYRYLGRSQLPIDHPAHAAQADSCAAAEWRARRQHTLRRLGTRQSRHGERAGLVRL
jgi:hypothetical protein